MKVVLKIVMIMMVIIIMNDDSFIAINNGHCDKLMMK